MNSMPSRVCPQRRTQCSITSHILSSSLQRLYWPSLLSSRLPRIFNTAKAKNRGLPQSFGSEYDRAVLEHGSSQKAEAKLADRETRGRNIENPRSRRHRAGAIRLRVANVQFPLRRPPQGCVTEADDLIAALLEARGYPRTALNNAPRMSPSLTLA